MDGNLAGRTGRHRQVRSFVIRGGRMSPAQQRAYHRLYGSYIVSGLVDPAGLFPHCRRVVVEVGFGMGDATVKMASGDPQCGFIGIEVHKPGIGKLLSEVERLGLDNVRIIHGDAVEVVRNQLSRESVHGFHVFFPDPWPKNRHHKRRLIQPRFAGLMEQALKPGGYVYAVTDWEDYAEQILAVLSAQPEFHNPFYGYADQDRIPVSRPQTKFERKGRCRGHRILEIYVKKVDEMSQLQN